MGRSFSYEVQSVKYHDGFCTTASLGKERNVRNWIFRARIDFIEAPELVCMGSFETFEEAYFEVKRHHEQPDERRAQNGGSL